MADFRRPGDLARLVLGRRGTGVRPPGESKMEKFESFVFAIGFVAAGLLTLVGQVTIV